MLVNGFKFVSFSDNEVMHYILRRHGIPENRGNLQTLRVLGNELRNASTVKYITHEKFKYFIEKNIHRFNL